jgi:hypothetical protein
MSTPRAGGINRDPTHSQGVNTPRSEVGYVQWESMLLEMNLEQILTS